VAKEKTHGGGELLPECIRFQTAMRVEVDQLKKDRNTFFRMLRGASSNGGGDSGLIGRVDMIEHTCAEITKHLEQAEKDRKSERLSRRASVFSGIVSLAVAIVAAAVLYKVGIK